MLRIGKLSILAIIVAGLTGCTDAPTPVTAPTPPPFTFGQIIGSDATLGYLVEADSGSSAPRRSYFEVASGTEIIWNGRGNGSRSDLQTGLTVGVWTDGTLLDSAPPRVIARRVVIYR
jgi:hypothetical protein